MNRKTTNKQGFTIIEVVLVLAIAGLIFMMVFLALPALQRSQRDTSRKSDLSRAMAQLTQYKAAHRGKLPSGVGQFDNDWNGKFRDSYLIGNGDEFIDPSGARDGTTDKAYAFKYIASDGKIGDFKESQNIIYYTVGAKCDEGGETLTGGQGDRVVSLRIKLENAGIHCLSE